MKRIKQRAAAILVFIAIIYLVYWRIYRKILNEKSFIPAVAYRAPFTGQLLIDVEFLKNIDNRHFQPISVKIANFAPLSPFSKPSNTPTTVIYAGIDDPDLDYFIFIINDEKYAIRKFEMISKQLTNIELYIPKNISNFLWEFERARFIECANIEMRRSPWTWRVIPLSFIESVAKMRDLLIEFRITPILFTGSLLGWYRECSIIIHTKDFDFAVLESEYKNEFLDELKTSREFDLYWTLGKPSKDFEMSVYSRGYKIDLFVLYRMAPNMSYFSGLDIENTEKTIFAFPEIKESDVCTGDLMGRLVFVPCDALNVIKADVGETWNVDRPSVEYSWNKSPSSVYKVEKVSEDEANDAVRCYDASGCYR